MHAYPRLDLPLPLELVNTLYAHAGQTLDALAAPADLDAWLVANDLSGSPATGQLEGFRGLRQALRDVFTAVVQDSTPPRDALEVLNTISAAAPQFARLDWRRATPHLTMVDVVRPSPLAAVARAAIDLLAGPDRQRIAHCQAPGCVLFFLRQGRRRDWCSAACGNRARVARHYGRHRRGHTAGMIENQN